VNTHIPARGILTLWPTAALAVLAGCATAALALLAGCGAAAAAHHPAKAAASHVVRPAAGCASQPGAAPGAAPGNKSPGASVCGSLATGHGSVLYWTRYRHAYEYYWQPRAGDMLVTDILFLPNGPLGMPLGWNGRLVTLGDGCVAADTVSAVRPPVSCIDSREEGRFRDMTPAEHRTVTDFWAVMRKVPASKW
jgi:hypothetical protein